VKGNRPLQIRLRDAERDRWETAARDAGVSVPEFVRQTVAAALDGGSKVETFESGFKSRSGPPLRVTAATSLPARTTMCPHRVPPTAYCSYCD
jgi:hypothetical protein